MAGAVLVAGVALSSCSIGAQKAPTPISRDSVPFGLLAPATTATTTPSVPSTGISIFLDGDQRLVPVDVQVPLPATPGSALSALSKGLTSADASAGLRSPVSTQSPLRLERVHSGTAVVDVPASFANLGGKDQIVAAAQIVYTLTAFPAVSSVQLLVGSRPAEIPTANGTLVSKPLTRSDYSAFAPL